MQRSPGQSRYIPATSRAAEVSLLGGGHYRQDGRAAPAPLLGLGLLCTWAAAGPCPACTGGAPGGCGGVLGQPPRECLNVVCHEINYLTFLWESVRCPMACVRTHHMAGAREEVGLLQPLPGPVTLWQLPRSGKWTVCLNSSCCLEETGP